MSESGLTAKEALRNIFILLTLLFVLVNVVVLYVEHANPLSDTNRKSQMCRERVEARGLSWTDVPAYSDAIDRCEARS